MTGFAEDGKIILTTENSLGWQNALIEEAWVQFPLTVVQDRIIAVLFYCRRE